MFTDARGRQQGKTFDDPLIQRGVELWLERVLGFYGEKGGVDIELIDDQIALNDRTADALLLSVGAAAVGLTLWRFSRARR